MSLSRGIGRLIRTALGMTGGEMSVVTLNGPIGAGGREVGLATAGLLKADYVDRLVFARAAERIGSTVAVLELKERQALLFRDRLAYFLRTMLERSAMSGAGGEPYFGPGIEYLPSEEYTELAPDPHTAAQRLNDHRFIESTTSVIKDLAMSGDVVINGRGGNLILQDVPGVLHVGMMAPLELRIGIIMRRENFGRREAEKYIENTDKAQAAYFKKFFKVQSNEPNTYHMMLNMGTMSVDTAAQIIAIATGKIGSGAQFELVGEGSSP